MIYLYLATIIIGSVVGGLVITWLITRDIDRDFYRAVEHWAESMTDEEWHELTKDDKERTA